MANDADQARLERQGRRIRSAYRSARLTPSQHDRHRARLAGRYDEPSSPLPRRMGALAAAVVMLLLAFISIAVWSSLSPKSDDRDERAIFTLPPTNSTPDTARPTVASTPSEPTSTSTSVEPVFGFNPLTGVCRTTPPSSGEPLDASQAAFTDTWYGGDPEGLWAGLGREQEGVWTTSNRVLWWRPAPFPIDVTGRRLDGNGPPMNANLLDGYEGFSHHISILRFPIPGCWEIEATAGDKMRLEFVVEVIPFEETPQGIEVQQQIDAVTAERENAIPYPVPETCAASSWIGPESRIYNQYPAEFIGDEDWLYSYFLDGDELSLNTRLGLLFEGENRLVWLSAAGIFPEGTMISASKVEEDGSMTNLEIEPPDHDSVVPDGSNGYLTLHGMRLTFPSAGCWALTVENDDVSFSHTVYVHPRNEVLDHERLYVVDQNGQVRGMDLESERELFAIETGSDVDAALSPDGSRLYLVNHDSLIALDALTGEEIWRAPVEDRISWIAGIGPSTAAISTDGERIYIYGHDGVGILSATDGSQVGQTDMVTGNCPAEMSTSLDGDTLYLVCIRFGSIRIVDLTSGEWVDSIAGQFSGSAISPNGSTLYTVTTSQRLIAIDMDSREIASDFELDLSAPPTLLREMVAISPDGTSLYVGLGREDNDGDSGSQDVHEIAIVNLADGSTVGVIKSALQFDVKELAVDRNGSIYANTSTEILRLTPVTDNPPSEGETVIASDVEIGQFLLFSTPDS